jgi:manganese oxidase
MLGASAATAGAAVLHKTVPHSHPWDSDAHAASGHGHEVAAGNGHAGHTAAHAAFDGSAVSNRFDPHEILRDFDYGKTSRLPNGRTLREWELVAGDIEIEVAPGVKFPAWTYNNRIPGPTLRAREGDRIRVTFLNGSEHPHTIHWHGIHPAIADGVPGIGSGQIEPGGKAVYEFDAEPFGVHLYHCHVRPLAEHIAKGMYGTLIIDPKEPRPEADELVMVMNGFDTNFDNENEVYAVNTVAFHYQKNPIRIRQGELVRAYVVNVTEFDLLNSFHIHGNLFRLYRTGTDLTRSEWTDVVAMCQGERAVLEFTYNHPGPFMFHAHQSEFAELGWSGVFLVEPPHV